MSRKCINNVLIKISNLYNHCFKNRNVNKLIPGSKVLKGNQKTNIKKYMDELDFAIKNKEIHNVSLSGGYGTGKSSIVKTYIKSKSIFSQSKYLVISIGSFLKYEIIETSKKGKNEARQTEEKTNTLEKEKLQNTNIKSLDIKIPQADQTKTQKEANEDQSLSNNSIDINELSAVDKIEESILKQLIHVNLSNETPNSDLKRIDNKKLNFLLSINAVFLMINVLCFIIINNQLFFEVLNGIINQCRFIKLFTIDPMYYLFLLFISFLFFIAFCIEKISNYKIVGKIKTDVVDIELKSFGDLPFNRNIYEILYFFSINKIKAVFFEDIDRFSPDVVILAMEELKELNSIINSSRAIHRNVTFIYEFKDNIFREYVERNKFYDYNISVMPLSTKENSIYLLDGLCLKENIAFDLKKIVSKYVTDYRTIINILNDYNLFKSILKIDSIQDSELFAAMVYKNVYIDEYDNLNKLNNELDVNISNIAILVDNKYNEIDDLIRIGNNLQKQNIIYLNMTNYSYCYNFQNLYESDNEGNIINAGDNAGVTSKEEFSKLTFAASLDKTKFKCKDYKLYEDTLKFFNYQVNHGTLSTCMESLNNDKETMKKRPNYDILNINGLGVERNLKNDLILSGYLNENYLDYISRPVNNNLFSTNDYRYINRVSHGFTAADLSLTHIDSVIKYIDPMENLNYRNHDMVSYLLDSVRLTAKEEIIIKNICYEFTNMTREKVRFFDYYFFNNRFLELREFLKKCFNYFDISKSFIRIKNEYDIDIDFIILEILKIEGLYNFSYDFESLRDYFNNNAYLLEMIDLENKIEISNIIELGIRIGDVSGIVSENPRLKDFILDNNLYSFTSKNLGELGLNFNSKQLNFENYVLDNAQLFFNEGYNLDESIKIENEIMINKFLKMEIDIKGKKEIMKREKFVTDYFEPSLLDDLYVYNHIKINWNCLEKYYKKCLQHSMKPKWVIEKNIIKLINYNSDILFNRQKVKKAIADDELNIKIIKSMLENEKLEFASKYLNVLEEDCISNKINDFEAMTFKSIEFGINKNLFVHNKRFVNFVMNNENANTSLKCKMFESIYDSEGISSNLKMIKNYTDVLLLFISKMPYSKQIETLEKLILPKELLIEVYPILFKTNKEYDLRIGEYNKIIKENKEKFNIRRVKHKYYISLK